MLGWRIDIYPLRPGAKTPAQIEASLLAQWEVGLGGIDWLRGFAAEGLAVDLGGSGYPLKFVLTARAAATMLVLGIPGGSGSLVVGDDYITPSGWTGSAMLKLKEIQALNPAELMAVDAWDLS